MKLYGLLLIGSIGATTTWADCKKAGIAIEETNFTLDCNRKGQCTAECDAGLINVGQKKVKCKYHKKSKSSSDRLLSRMLLWSIELVCL